MAPGTTMDEVARLRDSARAAPLARSARQSVATCHQAAVLRRERRAVGRRAYGRAAEFVYNFLHLIIEWRLARRAFTPPATGSGPAAAGAVARLVSA